MRTELSRISSFQSGFSGGKRALVVFFEYSKADASALTPAEIDEILQAATTAANARGAVGVCQATLSAVEPVELGGEEELVVRTELALMKLSPDATSSDEGSALDSGADSEEEGGAE